MNEYTSQELSQRLWDAGFRAEHTQEWHLDGRPDHKDEWYLCEKGRWWDEDAIRTYTFNELWSIVPKGTSFDKNNNGESSVCWMGQPSCPEFSAHESPAEALGLLVEWLIDNGHMTAKKEDSDEG